ncbi:MAG: ABC transporter ATP-binding protein [Clostridia bacterium]|nr:ABC transporter ATP-binding protein [Clostridia bacterium]
MSDKKTKPKYNMWQNTGYMVNLAWKNQKQVIFINVVIALLAVALSLAELYLPPVILQQVERAASLKTLATTILLFTAGLAAISGLQYYFCMVVDNANYGMRKQVLQLVQKKMLSMSFPLTENPRILALQAKAYEYCDSRHRMPQALWGALGRLIHHTLAFLIYLFLLTNLHPVLVVVVIVTTVISYAVTNHLNKWEYQHVQEENALEKQVAYLKWNAADRKIGKDVRVFGMGPWLKAVYASSLRLYDAFIARRERTYLIGNVVDLLLTLARNGIAYWYLISMTLREGLPASQFLLYFTAISGFATWVAGILEDLSTVQKFSLEVDNIRALLEWPEPFLFEEGKPLPVQKDGKYTLELKNVTFRYPGAEKDTLTRVNLTIPAGEKLAIVGLNGAGKTTLVKLLCGFYDPTEGAVLLNGQDIRQFNRRDYYEHFSAVFQQYSLLDVTVAENVAQSTGNIDMPLVKACVEKAGLTDKIQSLPNGFDTILGRNIYDEGVELSGGETQRLMLARALYKNAPIIVLDEPTAALDPIAEHDMYLKYDQMTVGRSAVYISHRLASTRFCDRIIFLKDGVIAEEGTHDGLLAANGGYAQLFAIQSKYYQEGGEPDGE